MSLFENRRLGFCPVCNNSSVVYPIYKHNIFHKSVSTLLYRRRNFKAGTNGFRLR